MAKVLCMEIGVSVIKIAEMDYQVKKPKVYQCIEVRTPEDAVKDGYLNPLKLEALKETIRNALQEKKIRTKRVLFTVFSGKIISREIMLPSVKPHQISAIIQANITEYFPIELDEYKISHLLIDTLKEGENAGKHKVLVIAVENSLLAGYDKLATELGLRIVDIDYAGNSVVQASRHSAGAGAIMVVKMEEENSIITILQNGKFVLQRNINHASTRGTETEDDFEETLEALVGTMMRVADFYVSHDENNKIEHIYIMGEGSRKQKTIDTIAEQIQLPCSVFEHVRGVTIQKKAEEAPIHLFAAVIGSGISSVGFANEKEKERHETNYVSACLLMIVFFVVLTLAILSLALIPYNAALMEEKALKQKAEEYAPAKVIHDQYESMQQLYMHVEYGHLLTEHSNDTILDFLDELEKQLPKDVEMTEFSSDDSTCVMTMRVDDKETAAGVINKLRDFASLRSVTVESITEETPQSGNDVDINTTDTRIYFTITCEYNIAEPVAPDVATAAQEAAQETTATDAAVE